MLRLHKFEYLICLVGIACTLAGLTGCKKNRADAAVKPVDLHREVTLPFRFVAYGDSRFHDPNDTEDANPAVRVALVNAIANLNPAFIDFTGDLVYNGYDTSDWQVWDNETQIWRDRNIPVYPTLGNHEFHGNQKIALANYFQRFSDLNNSRYYSLRAANPLTLVLDSSQDETTGPQGDWLESKLRSIPEDVDFVFIMLHHPPYTSSSDDKKTGGGHAARPSEVSLAKMLEDRQGQVRARFVVFSGHVHNYERHEHGGITYFVSGGGGAHAYPIQRAADDPFQSKEVNYHYLLVEVDHQRVKITMNRVELIDQKAMWTQPDSKTITLSAATSANSAMH